MGHLITAYHHFEQECNCAWICMAILHRINPYGEKQVCFFICAFYVAKISLFSSEWVGFKMN